MTDVTHLHKYNFDSKYYFFPQNDLFQITQEKLILTQYTAFLKVNTIGRI